MTPLTTSLGPVSLPEFTRLLPPSNRCPKDSRLLLLQGSCCVTFSNQPMRGRRKSTLIAESVSMGGHFIVRCLMKTKLFWRSWVVDRISVVGSGHRLRVRVRILPSISRQQWCPHKAAIQIPQFESVHENSLAFKSFVGTLRVMASWSRLVSVQNKNI